MGSIVAGMSGGDGARKDTIWTVGHSARTEQEFLDLLSFHGIRYVADVRRFPGSRRHPHFRRENLERVLPRRGMAYLALGKELGGFRKEGYEAYMKTEPFRNGLEQLVGVARRGPAAILCAEAFPFRCHRRFLADALVGRDFQVRHILSQDRILPHAPVQQELPV